MHPKDRHSYTKIFTILCARTAKLVGTAETHFKSLSLTARLAAVFSLLTFIICLVYVLSPGPHQPVPKHFLELPHQHRDIRFGIKHYDLQDYYNGSLTLQIAERQVVLSRLFGLWSRFADTHGITFWLAHGTLLGWYWNQKIMPFDDDIDLQLRASDLHLLLPFNNTLIEGQALIDINPQYVDRTASPSDQNIIDARIIDVEWGYYIDLTGVVPEVHPGDRTVWTCKTPWRFQDEALFPLEMSTFEGVPARVPFSPTMLLGQEYRDYKRFFYLDPATYMHYVFNATTELWTHTGIISDPMVSMDRRKGPPTCKTLKGRDYRGPDCSLCRPEDRCSHRGICEEGHCKCEPQFTGWHCAQCAPGWTGPHCSVSKEAQEHHVSLLQWYIFVMLFVVVSVLIALYIRKQRGENKFVGLFQWARKKKIKETVI